MRIIERRDGAAYVPRTMWDRGVQEFLDRMEIKQTPSAVGLRGYDRWFYYPEMDRSDGPVRSIALNGVWRVTPSLRPKGWESMGLKEKCAWCDAPIYAADDTRKWGEWWFCDSGCKRDYQDHVGDDDRGGDKDGGE